MTNYLRVDKKNEQLVMDRAFEKNSNIVGSREYDLLQRAKQDYPSFVVVRKTIKKNSNKKTYSGLTYDYMRDYIASHETRENVIDVLNELEEMILISKCHSRAFRYPVIKKWFLSMYPEIVTFGMPVDVNTTEENILQIAS